MAEALDGGERGTGGAHVDYHGLYVAIEVKNVSTPWLPRATSRRGCRAQARPQPPCTGR
jgi:hypothetical protein